jgi:hypothetical protein
VTNQFLKLVGMICVVGGSFHFANKHTEEIETLKKSNTNNQIEIKELYETILFDNDVMIQKTERIERLKNDLEKAYSRFSKDQVKINDLDELNKSLVQRGYRKIFKASKLAK